MMRLEIPFGTIPPGHYGFAYGRYDADSNIFYPVPLHLVVRYSRRFWSWFRFSSNRGYSEQIQRAAFLKGRMKGYIEGRKQGQKDIQDNFLEAVRMGPHSLRQWVDRMGMEIKVKDKPA